METRKSTRCITRHDTQSNWESANPVLLDGEEILVECSDGITRRKVGDGASAYSALPFSNFGFADIDHTHDVSEDIGRILKDGLTDGQKNISSDGTVITTVASDGRTLTKTFTNNCLTITSVLKDAKGNLLGQMVREISEDGCTINTTITK